MFKQDGIWEKFKQNILDKENYINITLISALIGGGFQVIFLWSIGIFYLRFFSITQMISDTIAIFLPLLIISLIIWLWIEAVSSTAWEKDFVYIFIEGIVSVALVALISYILYHSFDIIEYLKICIAFIIPTLIWLIFRYTKNKKIVKIILFILLLIWIFYIFNRSIRKTFISPDNFINQNYICKNLAKNKCNIRYFNDKYIFIERENNKIEIIKFDTFFQK